MDLFSSGKQSDISIIVDGANFPVHKNILSAQSPVFEAMFSHEDTKEALERKVAISDASVDVMKDFLLYLYTGMRPVDNRQSLELLVLAEKVHLKISF